jgi:hypothetical protein
MAKREIKGDAYKWLKVWHLVFVTIWLGSALALLAGQIWLRTVPELLPYWILDTLNMIDWFVLVPGATGVVITGVIFSLKTHWGWGKEYYWIRAKWLIALLGVIVGTFYLAPWLHEMLIIAKAEGVEAYQNTHYQDLSGWLYFWGFVQVITLLYATFLSTFKPRLFRNTSKKS